MQIRLYIKRIVAAIYNGGEMVINDDISLSNNHSDFTLSIYNANCVQTENRDMEDLIEDTCDMNIVQNAEPYSFDYLKNQLQSSKDIQLDRDVLLNYEDVAFDMFEITEDLMFDGNDHIIDFNHLNINFKINCNAVFKNITFKNADIRRNCLFEIEGEVIFENVRFINNNVSSDSYLIQNKHRLKNENFVDTEGCSVELIRSSFYNNVSRNNSLIDNAARLKIRNSIFVNNISDSKGTIIYNTDFIIFNSSRHV